MSLELVQKLDTDKDIRRNMNVGVTDMSRIG